ncbi:MAG: hypothetical protein GX111_05645 [Clostridiales bacterium]|nr:hypothetical protein [Clostridiales bacterium]
MSGLFCLAVLESEDEKLAEAVTRLMKKSAKWHNTSVLISCSDKFGFLNTSDIDLLIISPNAHFTKKTDLSAKCILLPGTLLDSLNGVESDYVITYGMSPRDTVTASSISDDGIVITLQRELVTLSGEILERQDLPKMPLRLPPPEKMMVVISALLLIGVPPDTISI